MQSITSKVISSSFLALRNASRSFSSGVSPLTELTTLPNGMRVASEARFGETASVGIWIDAGSRLETSQNNGTAHFLEHLSFKGTNKRSREQLEREVEDMGGHLNAYTSREQTTFVTRVFKDDVSQAVDLLGDIILNSKYDPSAIESERQVILRESEEVSKQLDEVVMDQLHETAFQGSSLGMSILGSEENIKAISRDDLVAYVQQHYTPDRMILVGAGNVNHDQLVDLASKHFGHLTASSSSSSSSSSMPPARFIGSDKRIRFDSMPTAHVSIAFQGASWSSDLCLPLMVAQNILGSWSRTSGAGGNVASRLGQMVVQDNLAHSFSAFNTCYKDTGLFGVNFTASETNLDVMSWAVLDNMLRLCNKVSDEEVERAKVQLKTAALMQSESFDQVAEEIGRQLLTFGRRVSEKEFLDRVDAVTPEQVRAACNQVVNDEDHAMAAIGPIYELPDYDWMRRRTGTMLF
jgi:processing peptidase subunit beta